MWKVLTDQIEHPLWEGSLQPATEAAARDLSRALGRANLTAADRDALRELPVVSIGRPEVCTLAEFCGPAPIPPALAAHVSDADYYIVEFCCNLRPVHDKHEIEWARFWATLLPHDGARAEARDLFPRELNDEVKHNVKVTLAPTLKFTDVEGDLGSAEFGREYVELQPKISAAGYGEDTPSWDFSETQASTVRGGKKLLALVKAPKSMAHCQADMSVAARVRVGEFWCSVKTVFHHEKPKDHLIVDLWGKS